MQKTGPEFSNHVFGPVPSHSEVNYAVSVLKNFVLAMSPDQSQPNCVVRILDSPTSKLLVSCGLKMLYRAFQLWQIDPFVKKLVVSLASDEVFWDAIMKNELVQKLGEKPLFLGDECEDDRGDRAGKEAELASTILQRIWGVVKMKVTELVESFQSLMIKMFQRGEIENLSPIEGCDEILKEKVASSFLLSVVITLIVVVVRSCVA